jgi:Nucleotidyltransferase/DNA polymerase involved in DNA repair
MRKNQETALHLDYSNEPRRDILCIDIKSFFASVEAVERNQHPLKAMIAVVSKPDNNGGLVLAASPFVKDKYNIRTGSRVYELPKKSNIEIVEPRMALYMEKIYRSLKFLSVMSPFKIYMFIVLMNLFSMSPILMLFLEQL